MTPTPPSFYLQAPLLLLVLLLPLAQSQSCTSLAGTSCSQCTRAGCSWCPVSGSCIPLTQAVSAGRCRFRMNDLDSCPESYCGKTAYYGTCGMCTLDYFCYWCVDSSSCGAWGACSSRRVIAYPSDCWAAAPPASPPTSPPALAPAPAPSVPPPAPPINSQPAYTPCVSGTAPTSCAPEQLSLQAMPNMCPAGPPNGPAYFAPFGIDPVSKCAIMPSRAMFAGDMSCSTAPVPSSCPPPSKYWSSLGSMASCSPQWAGQSGSGCGMCSPSVPIWAPYGRDTSGCPIVWCPQGCPFVWSIPSGPSPPPPAIGAPTPPSTPAPAPPSSCAGGLFATASGGGSSCSPCPSGSFCPPGSNSPSPCPAGTVSNYTGASSSTASPQRPYAPLSF